MAILCHSGGDTFYMEGVLYSYLDNSYHGGQYYLDNNDRGYVLYGGGGVQCRIKLVRGL